MKKIRKKRYGLPDTLRGLALLNMIAYHFVWNLNYFFNLNWELQQNNALYIWQQCICWTFIFVSGLSFSFAKKPLKNGIIVFVCGAIISAVTMYFMPEVRILFGILTLIGSCIIILSLLQRLLKKIPGIIGFLISASLFFVTRNVNKGSLGFEDIIISELPGEWYANLFTTYIGFTENGFMSTDYFSLIPWIFLFLCGYYVYNILLKYNLLDKILKFKIGPLAAIGQKTLIVYMIHQPILYGIIILMSLFSKLMYVG